MEDEVKPGITEDGNIKYQLAGETKYQLACESPQYSNRFFIWAGRDGSVRLSFADQPVEEIDCINIQATIVLTGAGLFTLQNHINKFIEMQTQTPVQPPSAVSKPTKEELN